MGNTHCHIVPVDMECEHYAWLADVVRHDTLRLDVEAVAFREAFCYPNLKPGCSSGGEVVGL